MTKPQAISDRWLESRALRIAALAGLALLLIARRTDAVTRPQFWAEDGMFYVDALIRGGSSLLVPYAGYLHLGPRSTALLAAAFDPLWAPAIFTLVATGLLLAVLALLLSPRLPVTGRLWCALAVILVPDAREIFFNVANLQWVLGLGLIVLLLLPDARTPLALGGDLLLTLLSGLSGPFSLLLSPLFAFRAWQRRSRTAIALAVVALGTGAVQGWYIAHGAGATPEETGAIVWQRLPAVIGLHFGALTFAGGLRAAVSSVTILTLAGLTVIAGFVALLNSRAAPATRAILGAAGVLILASGFYRCRHFLSELLVPGNGERYFFIPEVLFLWLLLSAAESGKIWRTASRAFFLFFVTASLFTLRFQPFVDYDWARYANEIRAGRACSFPVNPPGMTIDVPARAH